MLKIFGTPNGRDCDGFTRRNFLQVGSLGAAGLSLPNLLAAKDQAAQEGLQIKNKSVIWVWLAGGPTHVETFDPKMTAPVEYRSITGECKTPITGVTVGGTFPEIAKCVDRMALVRSFAHGSSSHGTGTTWVMTGYNDRDNMKPRWAPSFPAPKVPLTRKPGCRPTSRWATSAAMALAGWARYQALSPSGKARQNMNLSVDSQRFGTRRTLLNDLDSINRQVDRSGQMEGLDGFEQQAFDLVLGSAKDAFDVKKEDPKVRERYGKGLGEQLLLAKRLARRRRVCECKLRRLGYARRHCKRP